MAAQLGVVSRVIAPQPAEPLNQRALSTGTGRSGLEKLLEVLQMDRRKAAEQQREWVLVNRNIQKNTEMWERVFGV
jgi:hypothetical protein